MNGIVNLILDFLVETSGGRSITVVIYGRSIYIRELLVKASFAHPDFPDFSKQVSEIVFSYKAAVLHPLLVHHIASYGKLPQHARTPLPELRRTD